MKATSRLSFVFAILAVGAVSSSGIENSIALRIGATWPWDVVNENSRIRLCGDAGVEFGYMFDRKFGIGLAADFFWNRVGDENGDSLDVNGQPLFRLTQERKSFMFPVGAYAVIDPVPQWIVHPAARFQIGYNSLVYGVKDSLRNFIDYYLGLYIRTGLDAVYNLGENSGIFAGADYQWARTKTAAKNFKRRDMGGFGIHAGFRALY